MNYIILIFLIICYILINICYNLNKNNQNIEELNTNINNQNNQNIEELNTNINNQNNKITGGIVDCDTIESATNFVKNVLNPKIKNLKSFNEEYTEEKILNDILNNVILKEFKKFIDDKPSIIFTSNKYNRLGNIIRAIQDNTYDPAVHSIPHRNYEVIYSRQYIENWNKFDKNFFMDNTLIIKNYFISDLLNTSKYNDKMNNYVSLSQVLDEWDPEITNSVQPKIFSEATIFVQDPPADVKYDNRKLHKNKRYFNYNYKLKLEKLIKTIEDLVAIKLRSLNQEIVGGNNIIEKCKVYSRILDTERYEKMFKTLRNKVLHILTNVKTKVSEILEIFKQDITKIKNELTFIPVSGGENDELNYIFDYLKEDTNHFLKYSKLKQDIFNLYKKIGFRTKINNIGDYFNKTFKKPIIPTSSKLDTGFNYGLYIQTRNKQPSNFFKGIDNYDFKYNLGFYLENIEPYIVYIISNDNKTPVFSNFENKNEIKINYLLFKIKSIEQTNNKIKLIFDVNNILIDYKQLYENLDDEILQVKNILIDPIIEKYNTLIKRVDSPFKKLVWNSQNRNDVNPKYYTGQNLDYLENKISNYYVLAYYFIYHFNFINDWYNKFYKEFSDSNNTSHLSENILFNNSKIQPDLSNIKILNDFFKETDPEGMLINEKYKNYVNSMYEKFMQDIPSTIFPKLESSTSPTVNLKNILNKMFLRRDTTTEQDKFNYQTGLIEFSNVSHQYNNKSILPFIDKYILSKNLNYIKTSLNNKTFKDIKKEIDDNYQASQNLNISIKWSQTETESTHISQIKQWITHQEKIYDVLNKILDYYNTNELNDLLITYEEFHKEYNNNNNNLYYILNTQENDVNNSLINKIYTNNNLRDKFLNFLKMLELLQLVYNNKILNNIEHFTTFTFPYYPENGYISNDYKILLISYKDTNQNSQIYQYFQKYVLINYLIILEKFRIKLKKYDEILLISETLKAIYDMFYSKMTDYSLEKNIPNIINNPDTINSYTNVYSSDLKNLFLEKINYWKSQETFKELGNIEILDSFKISFPDLDNINNQNRVIIHRPFRSKFINYFPSIITNNIIKLNKIYNSPVQTEASLDTDSINSSIIPDVDKEYMLTFIKIGNLEKEIKINPILKNLKEQLPTDNKPIFDEDYYKKTVIEKHTKCFIFNLKEVVKGEGNVRFISRTQLIDSINAFSKPNIEDRGYYSFYNPKTNKELLKNDDIVMCFIQGSPTEYRNNILNSLMFHKFSDLSPKHIIIGNLSLGANLFKINGPVLVNQKNIGNKLANINPQMYYDIKFNNKQININDFLSLSFKSKKTDFNFTTENNITTTIINEYLLVNKSIIYSYLQKNNFSYLNNFNEYINKDGLFKYKNQNNNRLPSSVIFFNLIYLIDMSIENMSNSKNKLKFKSKTKYDDKIIMVSSTTQSRTIEYSVVNGISYSWTPSSQPIIFDYNNIVMKFKEHLETQREKSARLTEIQNNNPIEYNKITKTWKNYGKWLGWHSWKTEESETYKLNTAPPHGVLVFKFKMAEAGEPQISYNDTNGNINNVILQLPMKNNKSKLMKKYNTSELKKVEKIEVEYEDKIIIYNVISIGADRTFGPIQDDKDIEYSLKSIDYKIL